MSLLIYIVDIDTHIWNSDWPPDIREAASKLLWGLFDVE